MQRQVTREEGRHFASQNEDDEISECKEQGLRGGQVAEFNEEFRLIVRGGV